MQRSHGRALLPEAVAAGLLAASWMRRATAESWRPVRAAALSEEVRQGGAARLVSAPHWQRRKDLVIWTPQAAPCGPCCSMGWGGATGRGVGASPRSSPPQKIATVEEALRTPNPAGPKLGLD
ncbi:hypothetical protein NDU88_003858 [Pleurodeles waltl]|uniref:Uncharacterized protein n=1 Tax=Pleurodeles waltl TaxID=8319 RepID=A0AAV7M4L7_PLEWA|nr:hypothetical protein NDU88_003858 [Pleurodeles waltl]